MSACFNYSTRLKIARSPIESYRIVASKIEDSLFLFDPGMIPTHPEEITILECARFMPKSDTERVPEALGELTRFDL